MQNTSILTKRFFFEGLTKSDVRDDREHEFCVDDDLAFYSNFLHYRPYNGGHIFNLPYLIPKVLWLFTESFLLRGYSIIT